MAVGTMATAAGAAVILYYLLSRRLSSKRGVDGEDGKCDISKSIRSGRRRISRRLDQAPATWFEAIHTLSETLRFMYSETLGKWPIGDLAFGINYLIRRQVYSPMLISLRVLIQYRCLVCRGHPMMLKLKLELLKRQEGRGNEQVASVYASSECIELKGLEIISELKEFLKFLTLCILFSKKSFPVFLESAGYTKELVLLHKPKAGLLKPAFTIVRDNNSKCFLLLIRGTHSIKDTLTAATGAVVPFHHTVFYEGGVNNIVLGYAHCGMVASARWIAKLSTPSLQKALVEYPDYQVKIIGHSLGGGTAALLAYILREQKELSSSTCVTFAPAACMTWELAESGKHFITTVINGSDLVPTFSAASVDDLRSEVNASSWLNDLRDQVKHTKVINVVYRSATALGSRLPSMATAKAKVAGAGALLHPVSSSTQVVMKRAKNVAQAVVRTQSSLSSWYCIGARRRNISHSLNTNVADPDEASLVPGITSSTPLIEETISNDRVECISLSHESDYEDSDEEILIQVEEEEEEAFTTTAVEDVTKGELWNELEKELQREENNPEAKAREEEEATAAKEITEEEENILAEVSENDSPTPSGDVSENHQFYPPGRIMHMVSVLPSSDSANLQNEESMRQNVGIFETPRELYNKLRLSRTMIKDHYMPMYRKMVELLIEELESNHSDQLLCN